MEVIRATAIARMSAPILSKPHSEQLLNIAEAAKRLNVSEDYLYRHWKTLPLARKDERMAGALGRAISMSTLLKKMANYEIIDAKELAKRWKLPESWIRDYVRSRTIDPIPHVQFGKYVRFEWQHPSLMEWLDRHRTYYQHKNGKGT